MTATIDKIISDICNREGGYVNRETDKGGPTNHGITQSTLSTWYGRPATIDEVKALPLDVAKQIYYKQYIVAPGFDKIADAHLQELIVDTGVNHGTHEASILLQRALGVTEDGSIGPKTLAVLAARNRPYVWLRVMGYRLRCYAQIVADDKQQCRFAQGWFNRCIGLLAVYSSEIVLDGGVKTQESIEALHLAASFQPWSKLLYPLEAAEARAYGTFIRAGGDCIATAAKFQ